MHCFNRANFSRTNLIFYFHRKKGAFNTLISKLTILDKLSNSIFSKTNRHMNKFYSIFSSCFFHVESYYRRLCHSYYSVQLRGCRTCCYTLLHYIIRQLQSRDDSLKVRNSSFLYDLRKLLYKWKLCIFKRVKRSL